MKKAFSLLEMIFAIMIIAILSSFAIPKFTNLLSTSKVTSIKQDINTIIRSIRSAYLINGSIDKISDILVISSNWVVEDKRVLLKENDKDCIIISLESAGSDYLKLYIDPSVGNFCQELYNNGIKEETFNLE